MHQCARCGKTFHRSPSAVGRFASFCNWQCRRRPDFVCEQCGMKFHSHGAAKRNRFCSRACYAAAMQALVRASIRPDVRLLGWVAGFLEGEGCFFSGSRGSVSGSRDRVCVAQAAQVNREPLERLRDILGGRIRACSGKGKRQDHFVWYTQAARARGVMMTLFPLLSHRRRQQIVAALRGA